MSIESVELRKVNQTKQHKVYVLKHPFNKILNNSRSVPRERSHKIKFYSYAFISVGGLLISSVIFYLSISLLNIPVFYANWIGDIIALSFVFLCSWITVCLVRTGVRRGDLLLNSSWNGLQSISAYIPRKLFQRLYPCCFCLTTPFL